ncbi:hypothetical protein OH77DRAFT_1438144 [Trametes cingulata]|nr:hypothetical protein OH77DRAFT_1438144 [Trametes cingulata]
MIQLNDDATASVHPPSSESQSVPSAPEMPKDLQEVEQDVGDLDAYVNTPSSSERPFSQTHQRVTSGLVSRPQKDTASASDSRNGGSEAKDTVASSPAPAPRLSSKKRSRHDA